MNGEGGRRDWEPAPGSRRKSRSRGRSGGHGLKEGGILHKYAVTFVYSKTPTICLFLCQPNPNCFLPTGRTSFRSNPSPTLDSPALRYSHVQRRLGGWSATGLSGGGSVRSSDTSRSN